MFSEYQGDGSVSKGTISPKPPTPAKKGKKCEVHLKTHGCDTAISHTFYLPRKPDLVQV